MPEAPPGKVREHPLRRAGGSGRAVRDHAGPDDAPAWAELEVRTNFSFLEGASHPEELVEEAARLGLAGVAIADRNSVAGVVRAHVEAKRSGVPLALGARIDVRTGRFLHGFGTRPTSVPPATAATAGRIDRGGDPCDGDGDAAAAHATSAAHAADAPGAAEPPHPTDVPSPPHASDALHAPAAPSVTEVRRGSSTSSTPAEVDERTVADVLDPSAPDPSPSVDVPSGLPSPDRDPSGLASTDDPPADRPPTDLPPTDRPPADLRPTDLPPADLPPPDLELLVFATSVRGWGRLCRLLTVGKRRAAKGDCILYLHDVIDALAWTPAEDATGEPDGAAVDAASRDSGASADPTVERRETWSSSPSAASPASVSAPLVSDDLLVVVVPPPVLDGGVIEAVAGLRAALADARDDVGLRLSIAAGPRHGADDEERLAQVVRLAAHVDVPVAATNDVRHHVRGRRALLDVLTCIRHGCTLDEAGERLEPNGERHLHGAAETHALLLDRWPEVERGVVRPVHVAAGPPSRARARAVRAAMERSAAIVRTAARFSLDDLAYRYPREVCPDGLDEDAYLRRLAEEGARARWPGGVPEGVRERIEHELALVAELGYASYFLTVHDIVRFARSRGILCQGRGAAANSVVCFCLGLTSVDPERIDLLFERFVSRERDEPPDIDIDFEHERREEVIQYVYARYGRDRAALTAEVISYRGRSAVREVGKAMGLSLDLVDRLAKSLDWWSGHGDHDGFAGEKNAARLRELGLDAADPLLAKVMALVGELVGFPRHLSQHVGGFVITRGPLCEMVPVENAAMPDRTVIEWDKDDLDAMGMLKIDVLGLGMLTCVRKAFDLVREHEGLDLDLATVPPEDPVVYDMICEADTVGVFQIESRAQMTMLPRLRPRCFYDLVIEVAIVRPGPIVGDMVHPYLRRRQGLEPVSYPRPEVRRVLEKTLGVPLFQEQAMALAVVAAGFTPGEADRLRRAMAAWKRKGNAIGQFREKFVGGMLERGYEPDFADRCFEQLKGFSEYGFPESHAASFALIVYVSCWLKRHRPAAFAAALINSQPMGFYAPAQIVRDAKDHGVEVRPVDVNHSGYDCRLEGVPRDPITFAPDASRAPLRLGMRLVKGLGEEDARMIERAVAAHGAFDSLEGLWRASGVRVAALRALARADAFGSMGLTRQAALWATRALRDDAMPLFEAALQAEAAAEAAGEGAGEAADEAARESAREATRDEAGAPRGIRPPGARSILPTADEEAAGADRLPVPTALGEVARDYASVRLSLKSHPVAFLRGELDARGVIPARRLADARRTPHRTRVAVAGIALVRQRPSTASGVVFITLEDETGIANLILRPEVYERFRPVARGGTLLLAAGQVERQGSVVHVGVTRVESLDGALGAIATRSRDFR